MKIVLSRTIAIHLPAVLQYICTPRKSTSEVEDFNTCSGNGIVTPSWTVLKPYVNSYNVYTTGDGSHIFSSKPLSKTGY